MIKYTFLASAILLTGCVHSKKVKNFGVDYNVALESMANEQALLNILRAKEGMPAHFTSVNRFTGVLNLQANTGISGQLGGKSSTNTLGADSLLTTTDANGTTTALTEPQSAMSVIAKGVDAFTPQISGQVTTGTTLEVGAFDDQDFFQGYTSALPLSTVDTFFKQGFDNEMIFYLMVSQIEYFLDEKVAGYVDEVGDRVGSVENNPNNSTDMGAFKNFFRCNNLYTVSTPNKIIAPVSRFKSKPNDNALSLENFLKIDGKTFDFENTLNKDPNKDDGVSLSRVAKTPLSARFELKPSCRNDGKGDGTGTAFEPPTDFSFAGTRVENVALRDPNGVYKKVPARVSAQITFRSPESVLRYLGQYLRATDKSNESSLLLSNDRVLFSIQPGKTKEAQVSTKFRGKHYSVENDADSVRNMEIINIVQQVVNLQKSSSDAPLSIPVRTVP